LDELDEVNEPNELNESNELDEPNELNGNGINALDDEQHGINELNGITLRWKYILNELNV
jgi:hypothetical protein